MLGRTPAGSSREAPSSHSSSGTPGCVNHSCQLPKPSGGEASTYPNAKLQNAADTAGRRDERVRRADE
jgi:hypothetical protein